MPEVAKYFHNYVTNMPRVKKSGHKSCTWVELERHQSVKTS